MITQPTRPVWFDLSPETIVQLLWPERRRLMLITGLSTLLGIGVALWLEPTYATVAQLMPEMSNGADDVVRRLASVAGFSGLDMADTEGMETIRPDLYPNVLQSTPFLLYLIDQPLTTTNGQQTTVGQLISPEQEWMQVLKRLLSRPSGGSSQAPRRPNGPVRLTARQRARTEAISERVSARFDSRSGIITISANMPDAVGAATVAQLAMNYLTQYVTNYRTEKARRDLTFYARRLAESHQRYQTAQFALFRYNDQHRSVVLQAATVERQQLAEKLATAQSLYADLSRWHEQARLKVQQQTPVFKVLEPPTVPLERVSPKRTLIVLGFALAGFVAGVGYMLIPELPWVTRWRTMLTNLQRV